MLYLLIFLALALWFVRSGIAVVATTVWLHRSLNHEGFKLDMRVQKFFRVMCWTDTGSVPRAWVSVHRKHHSATDMEGDPHSPIMEGFWKVQLFNTFYYIKAAAKLDQRLWAQGVPDFGWMDRNSTLGMGVGIAYPTLLFTGLAALVGVNPWIGCLIGFLSAWGHLIGFMFINALVNAYCHVRGYKTFPDAYAYNVRWIAILTGGEGLHNNHHANERCPRLRTGAKAFEFDLGWTIIKWLDKKGLVSEKGKEWPKETELNKLPT